MSRKYCDWENLITPAAHRELIAPLHFPQRALC
jgi:hypothetical protein